MLKNNVPILNVLIKYYSDAPNPVSHNKLHDMVGEIEIIKKLLPFNVPFCITDIKTNKTNGKCQTFD